MMVNIENAYDNTYNSLKMIEISSFVSQNKWVSEWNSALLIIECQLQKYYHLLIMS